MVKGAEDVMRDAPQGQPDNTRDADVDEIHLVKVAFAWDTRWYSTLYEKINKYEPLLRTLRRRGYKVFLHPMIFGVTGSVNEHNERALTKHHLGFRRKEAAALLKTISGKAVEWATKIRNSQNEAERELTSKNSKKPP
ncbi:hypothetical protein CYMTET_15689 [Cymbomonas tetramitiformis]|uniref:Uncharacterized protein n=1 Tax=Cymbomonas tetramitiformis TaxID=36881 RepID=A0AAE0GDY6_9CHLO|nr:hypothetical protein CYMTET_15689 [Cymbomonas tetramitiformis]